MNLLSGFADISLIPLILVACVALFASLIGGVAGYGTGALMPLVLVPLIGAGPVVPIIAISAIFSNFSRATAYRRSIDRRRAGIVMLASAVTTALGAYGYAMLTSAGAAVVIGGMLILSVPLRRFARRRKLRIGKTGLGFSAAAYGVVLGGTSGSGVILLSLLMASGLEGAAVIATDAAISLATGVIKISVFGMAGVVTPQVIAFALLIGLVALPSAFLAKSLVERMPLHFHRHSRCCRARRRDRDDVGWIAASDMIVMPGLDPAINQFKKRWIGGHKRAEATPLRMTMPGNDTVPQGHFTSGGIDDRIESTLPPVLRPKIVPLS